MDQEYFSDGIADELLNVLARVEGIHPNHRSVCQKQKVNKRRLLPLELRFVSRSTTATVLIDCCVCSC
jgi:TolB-like protein